MGLRKNRTDGNIANLDDSKSGVGKTRNILRDSMESPQSFRPNHKQLSLKKGKGHTFPEDSNLAKSRFDTISRTSDLFRMLSDNKCFAILKTIAANKKGRGGEEVKKEKGIGSMNMVVSLTELGHNEPRKELLKLIKADLVAERKIETQNDNPNINTSADKTRSCYILTEQGQEVYDACAIVEDAINIEPKLKTLESLFETLPNHTEAGEIKGKLVDGLIDNYRIKDSLQNGMRL